jgi:hypothetical protein
MPALSPGEIVRPGLGWRVPRRTPFLLAHMHGRREPPCFGEFAGQFRSQPAELLSDAEPFMGTSWGRCLPRSTGSGHERKRRLDAGRHPVIRPTIGRFSIIYCTLSRRPARPEGFLLRMTEAPSDIHLGKRTASKNQLSLQGSSYRAGPNIWN